MRTFHLPLCLTICLMACLEVGAQTPVKLALTDGSSIRCTVLAQSLPVETEFGTLTVPLNAISRIRFGIHCTAGEKKLLDAAAKSLGSAIHKERDGAYKDLRSFGRIAIPHLRIARSLQTGSRSVAGTVRTRPS